MEKHLKRKLISNEIVHHIDGDRLNNCIENLQLFNNKNDHMRLHHHLWKNQCVLS
jgi:hypothetical protein